MRESEKKQIVVSLIAILALIFIVEFIIGYKLYKKYVYIKNGDIVAKVNNINIYENDISLRLNNFITDSKENNIFKNKDEIIKAIIYEAYFDKYFMKEFYNKPFNKNEISQHILDNKRKIIKSYYLQHNIIDKITEADLLNKYDEMIKLINEKEERHIYHILVSSEEEADRIRKNIFRFNNFEYQASQFSLDTASGKKGGDLGYLLKYEIEPKNFADLIFILKQDEISKPFQTEKGWHIVKVVDIRQVETKKYEDIKDVIKIQLEQERVSTYLDDIIQKSKLTIKNNSIFKKLNIEFYNEQ